MSEVTVNAKIGDETILFTSKENALIFIANFATFQQFKTYCDELQVDAQTYRHYRKQTQQLKKITMETMTDKNRTVYDMLKEKTS